MINTIQDLRDRFDTIAHKAHTVTRTSSGAVGELFEELMVGEIVGNQKGADFVNIETEAKVHYRAGEVTIFSFRGDGLKPSEIKAKRNKSTVRTGDGLTENNGRFTVKHNGETLTSWKISDLEARITEKMPNLAIVKATKTGNKVTYDKMAVCQHIVPSRFIDSIRNGEVRIELRSKGTSFRANPAIVEGWFEVLH